MRFLIGKMSKDSILVHLHTIYQKPSSSGLINKMELPYVQGQTIDMLMRQLDLTIPEDSSLIVVNGKVVDPAFVLRAGDEVHFIPAISGGESSQTGDFHDGCRA
jgi:sulfur carrier protein ThiS